MPEQDTMTARGSGLVVAAPGDGVSQSAVCGRCVMRRFATLGTLLAALLVLCAGPAPGQLYEVHFTGPAALGLRVSGRPTVLVRTPGADWQPAQFSHEGERIVITLDPAKHNEGRALLLVNPPPGMDIGDARPPRLSTLRVDGRTLSPQTVVDLGALARAPRRVTLTFLDRENALDLARLRLWLDELRLQNGLTVTSVRPNRICVAAALPQVSTGQHVLRYVISDASPQANILEGEIRFGYYDLRNLALAVHGTQLTSDSHFPGYDSLPVLHDGSTWTAPNTLPPETTWASAETANPHWVELDFGRVRTVREMRIYWANYAHEFHTSRHIEVQVPEGESWRAVYTSPPEGEPDAVVTVVRFAPVSVSRLRLYQPPGGGSPKRPQLLWLAEIEVR